MNKKEKKKHGMSSYTFRRKVAPWCILAPPIFFTLWLKYYPIVSAFFISLFKYDPINPPGKFVGFKNYQDMFQMDFYWQSWKNTLIFLLLQLAMCFFIPLIQALLLNELQRFKNYQDMFQMDFYWQSWKNTLIFLLLQLAMCFFIPLIQALLLNELQRLQKGLTTLYILPALIPTSVNVIIWRWIWHPDYGVANQIVKFFGGEPQAWLSDPELVKFCIIFPTSVNVIIWRWIWHPDYGVANQIVKFFGGEPQAWLSDPELVKFCIIFPGVLGGGLTVLLYLSAIQGISGDILESAALDGCTGFSKITKIILPNISFMVFIQLIMCVITTMQLLDAPYMYASGGPSGSSTTQGIFIYQAFNQDLNYGRGSAASIILLIVTALLTMVQMHFEKSERE